jgi:glutamine phosphoribosylpyrophosphate amidotransferase
MPVGLLYQLFHAAEHRGRDSTGVAYWDVDKAQNVVVKHAVTATLFTKFNAQYVSGAQRAPRGIAHTRRASPKMPVDNDNAHPFMYESYVFAHNGVVKNWQQLRDGALPTLEDQTKKDTLLQSKLDYMKRITTDSMILGPAIESRNFSPAVGALGLVWLHGEKIYAFRSKKELTSAVIKWNTEEKPKEENKLIVVASTWEIIALALSKLENVQYDADERILLENHLYEISDETVIDSGQLPVNSANQADKFTSTCVDGQLKDPVPA